MNEHILRTVVGLNEAVPLCRVEPLHGSNSHGFSFKNTLPPLGSKRRVKLLHGGGAGPVLDQELGRAAEPREVDGKQISSPPLACNSQHHHRSAERRPTNHITSAKGVVGKSAASRLCTLRDALSGRPQHEVLLRIWTRY